MRRIPGASGYLPRGIVSSCLAFLPVVVPVLLGVVVGFVPVFDAVAQGNDGVTAVVLSVALNIRSGPGVDHTPIGSFRRAPGCRYWLATRRVVGARFAWRTEAWDGSPASGHSCGWRETRLPFPQRRTTPRRPCLRGEVGEIVFQPVTGGRHLRRERGWERLHRLTSGIDPSLSPDGNHLAFTAGTTIRMGPLGSLWSVDLDGSNEHVVVGGAGATEVSGLVTGRRETGCGFGRRRAFGLRSQVQQ